MGDPIEVYLKTEIQLSMARMQDNVVESIFNIEPNIIMHGGTAIWRCYNGNRFSDDIDIYATEKQINKLSNNLTLELSKRNAKIAPFPYSNRLISIYNDSAKIKLESMMLPKHIRKTEKEYEKIDGSKIFITTLLIEDFIEEKITAYKKREYARDLYDIYYLTTIDKLSLKTRKMIKEFLKNISKPMDEGSLQALIYKGIAPSFETMVNSIKSRLK